MMKVSILFLYLILFFGCTKDSETYKLDIKINPSFDSAEISWNNPFDNNPSVLYQIFINDEKIVEQENETLYTLLDLRDNQAFTGYITAVCLNDGKSAQEDFTFSTRKRDYLGEFNISIVRLTGNQIEFTWQSPVMPEGGLFYDIYLNDSLIYKDVNIRK